jgi:hypothetical protein
LPISWEAINTPTTIISFCSPMTILWEANTILSCYKKHWDSSKVIGGPSQSIIAQQSTKNRKMRDHPMVCTTCMAIIWSRYNLLEVGVVSGDAYGQWKILHSQKLDESTHWHVKHPDSRKNLPKKICSHPRKWERSQGERDFLQLWNYSPVGNKFTLANRNLTRRE